MKWKQGSSGDRWNHAVPSHFFFFFTATNDKGINSNTGCIVDVVCGRRSSCRCMALTMSDLPFLFREYFCVLAVLFLIATNRSSNKPTRVVVSVLLMIFSIFQDVREITKKNGCRLIWLLVCGVHRHPAPNDGQNVLSHPRTVVNSSHNRRLQLEHLWADVPFLAPQPLVEMPPNFLGHLTSDLFTLSHSKRQITYGTEEEKQSARESQSQGVCLFQLRRTHLRLAKSLLVTFDHATSLGVSYELVHAFSRGVCIRNGKSVPRTQEHFPLRAPKPKLGARVASA